MFPVDNPEQSLTNTTLLLLAIVLLVQQAGVPIPFPTMLIVIAAGLGAALGFHPLALAFGVMLAALWLGLVIQYLVAQRRGTAGSGWLGKYIEVDSGRLATADQGIQKRGWLAVLLGIAFPIRRNAMVWAAGIRHMPFLQFLAALVVGSILYVAWNFVIAFLVAGLIQQVRTWTPVETLVFALAIGVIVSLLRWQLTLTSRSEALSAVRRALPASKDSSSAS